MPAGCLMVFPYYLVDIHVLSIENRASVLGCVWLIGIEIPRKGKLIMPVLSDRLAEDIEYLEKLKDKMSHADVSIPECSRHDNLLNMGRYVLADHPVDVTDVLAEVTLVSDKTFYNKQDMLLNTGVYQAFTDWVKTDLKDTDTLDDFHRHGSLSDGACKKTSRCPYCLYMWKMKSWSIAARTMLRMIAHDDTNQLTGFVTMKLPLPFTFLPNVDRMGELYAKARDKVFKNCYGGKFHMMLSVPDVRLLNPDKIMGGKISYTVTVVALTNSWFDTSTDFKKKIVRQRIADDWISAILQLTNRTNGEFKDLVNDHTYDRLKNIQKQYEEAIYTNTASVKPDTSNVMDSYYLEYKPFNFKTDPQSIVNEVIEKTIPAKSLYFKGVDYTTLALEDFLPYMLDHKIKIRIDSLTKQYDINSGRGVDRRLPLSISMARMYSSDKDGYVWDEKSKPAYID